MTNSKALFDKNKWIAEIGKYFNEQKVEQIARETKFIQRKSKLCAMDFFFLCVFSHQKNTQISLEGLSAEILKEGKSISKQSLQDRFNEYASLFMERLAGEMLQQKLDSGPIITHPIFTRIIIGDSTVFQLPEIFAEKYRGSGGDASKSAVKVQYSFDLLSQKIIVILVKEAVIPDYQHQLTEVKKTIYT
jgi:hypothetical protein